jgi:hypothetical protein
MAPAILGENDVQPHTGIKLFLPWYLLRDQNLKFRDIAKRNRDLQNPSHLQGWLSSKDGKNLGITRLKNLFTLYRYWQLILADRYQDRIPGNRQALRRAFAAYLKVDADSIKKLRKHLHL